MKGDPPTRTKRYAFILSGAIDAVIGAIALLIGFGLLPIDIADYGIPAWLVIFVGAFMFIMGAWMAAYNYSGSPAFAVKRARFRGASVSLTAHARTPKSGYLSRKFPKNHYSRLDE